ncbi:hypothetical protein PIB30_064429 [Stylosanthes scabra]|uniref:Uncharacterized protein n=1 Tax=Stylosanthes scabra TaxID=79078 RepID=A0ABU6QMT6_9FABA|nr:hypothetical protein [Stylosanthes scabra]
MRSVFENPSDFTTYSSIQMDRDMQILGSCNGLICFGLMRKRKRKRKGLLHLESIRLWNPCTRSASDWLKLEGQKGSNSWKSIIQDPLSYEPKAAIGTFVKGTLNWAAHARSNVSKWVILSFDLAKNRFLPLSLPDLDLEWMW